MPPSLPLWGDKRDYGMDAPITVFGTTQARLVGASWGGYHVTSWLLCVHLVFTKHALFQARPC